MPSTDLPPSDFENLEVSIRQKLRIEILHNMGMIDDATYFQKFSTNAESLDRDFTLWKELQDLEQ